MTTSYAVETDVNRLSQVCWYGMALNFFESVIVGSFYFLSLYFVHDLHFSIQQSGVFISMYGGGAILGGYLGGKLSDRFPPINILISNFFCQAILFIALIVVTSEAYILFIMFMFGLSGYSFITASQVWVLGACSTRETRLKAINIFSCIANLGMAFSACLISELTIFGFKKIFLFLSIFILSLTFLLYIFRHIFNKPSLNKNKSVNEINEVNIKYSKNVLYIILLSLFLIGLIIAQINSTYPIYLKETFYHLGIHSVSTLFIINAMLVIFLQLPIVNYFKNKNSFLLASVGALLIGMGMLILGCSNLFFYAIIACVIYTIGEMFFFSMTQLLCYNQAPEQCKGKHLGYYRMTFAASRVIGPALGGSIYGAWGGEILWWGCTALGFSAAFGCAFSLIIKYNLEA